MDPQKSDTEWSKIAGTLKSVGMPEEVVQAAFGKHHDPNVPLVSPPMFELIRKAALYDAAVAQHTKATAPGKAQANGDHRQDPCRQGRCPPIPSATAGQGGVGPSKGPVQQDLLA